MRDQENLLHLAGRLRSARDHAGMNQTEAAGILGITSAALSNYESGKRHVDALTLERLAYLYGLPLSYFFNSSNTPEWEAALRALSQDLSIEGKAGISQLILKVQSLEQLFALTETAFPKLLRPPFDPLGPIAYTQAEVATYADKVRRHFDLGMAPLTKLRRWLEALGYQIFCISLGQDRYDLSGFFFRHGQLGPIIVINSDQSYTRQPFTMAHELAHSLFHYDHEAILCRNLDDRPLEAFAEQFAGYFLIPQEALQARLIDLGIRKVQTLEEIVHLARYFGVSFQAIRKQLEKEGLLHLPKESFYGIQPLKLAQQLGYTPSRFEMGARPLPIERSLPRVFLELTYRGVHNRQLSMAYGAELLGISDIELEERLHPVQEEASEEE